MSPAGLSSVVDRRAGSVLVASLACWCDLPPASACRILTVSYTLRTASAQPADGPNKKQHRKALLTDPTDNRGPPVFVDFALFASGRCSSVLRRAREERSGSAAQRASSGSVCGGVARADPEQPCVAPHFL